MNLYSEKFVTLITPPIKNCKLKNSLTVLTTLIHYSENFKNHQNVLLKNKLTMLETKGRKINFICFVIDTLLIRTKQVCRNLSLASRLKSRSPCAKEDNSILPH